MPSQDKLIRQGIYLTGSLFDEIRKRLAKGVKSSDTLESFLHKTQNYTMNNPLVMSGYKDDLLEIILKETNNHRFSRPAQKELTRLTIENMVGDLIVDVGEDVKNSVREIVKNGYDNNLSQDEIAKNITKKVTTIENTRAKTIARTEIARTATACDYVINLERGATHFKVDCRSDCCKVCEKDYHWGDVEYEINQVEMLPPRHPNCRCYAIFFIKNSNDTHFSEFKEGQTLDDGKPNISWTKDSLREKLSDITNSEEELNHLTEGIWNYMNGLENRNEEAISAMGHDYKMYCEHHTIKSRKGVDLCHKGIEESDKGGLFLVIHNHPSNNPLQSKGDVIGFAGYNIKYNVVFTEERGLLIFKNDSAINADIIKGWQDTYKDMFNDLKKDYSSNYYHIMDLYRNGGLKDDEFEELVYNEVIHHMSKNVELSIEYFTKNMQKYGVDVSHITP